VLRLGKFLAACVLLWCAGGGPAPAGELGGGVQDVRRVRWPHFDPKTGKRISVVTAEKAWPEDGKTYRVQRPKVIVYGTEYEINVTSESGVVKLEGRRGVACTLEGNVTVRISDPGKTVVTAEKLEWVASERILRTDSAVEVRRTDLAVKGVGMELRPQEGSKELRFIQFKKDTQAEISPRASTSGIFSSVTGKAEPDGEEGEEGSPMFISSKGPMTINRDTNVVSFEDNVEVRRQSFKIHCDKLTMSFDPETRKVKDILARGNVRVFGAENGASGDVLSWDALSGLVEVFGNPARTWRGPATVAASTIWFSPKDAKVLWTGRAQIYAPPEGPASLMHFGGGSQ